MNMYPMKPNSAIYLGIIVLMFLEYNYCSTSNENEPYFLPSTLTPLNYKLLVYTNMDTAGHEYWGTVNIKVK